MAQIGSFTRDDVRRLYRNDQDAHPQRQGQHQALRARQRQGARLPGHRQRRRVRRRLEQDRPRDRSRNISLKLDDPSFTAPVYASLVQGDKGEHKLIWSR